MSASSVINLQADPTKCAWIHYGNPSIYEDDSDEDDALEDAFDALIDLLEQVHECGNEQGGASFWTSAEKLRTHRDEVTLVLDRQMPELVAAFYALSTNNRPSPDQDKHKNVPHLWAIQAFQRRRRLGTMLMYRIMSQHRQVVIVEPVEQSMAFWQKMQERFGADRILLP